MLLDDREMDHHGGARGISLWMVGVGLWAVLGLARQLVSWLAFSGEHDSFELVHHLFTALQLGSLSAGILIALGAWRYARATAPGLLQAAAGVFALDALIDAVYLLLTLTAEGADYEQREMLYEVLGHAWRVVALLRVGALVLFFTRMARVSEGLASPIAPARVWGAIGVAGAWGLILAANSFELLPRGAVGMIISGAMTLAVGGTTLAVFFPHRRHLREGASVPEDSATELTPGLAAAGRGLSMYHGAVISQISWLVVGNGLTLLVAKTGDMEGARGMMGLVPIVALAIQLFAIAGLLRFARHLPTTHLAKGPAGWAAGAQVLGGLLSLGTVGLVLRALESGRLRYLFDLQDQLPVLQGIGTLLGCFAALALLSALEHVGVERQLGGLKVAIPVLGGLAFLFHVLEPRDLGAALLLAFAVALLIGAIVVAVQFLGVVRRTAEAMRMGAP